MPLYVALPLLTRLLFADVQPVIAEKEDRTVCSTEKPAAHFLLENSGTRPAEAGKPVTRSAVGQNLSLDEILRRWSAASIRRGQFQADFKQFQYDETFHIETRGVGRLEWASPNCWKLSVRPVSIPAGARSRRTARASQKPFKLKSVAAPETLECDGIRVIWQYGNRKRFEFGQIDRTNPRTVKSGIFGNNVHIHELIQGFSGLTERNLKDLYQWRIMLQTDNTVWLKAVPREKSDYSYRVIVCKEKWQEAAIEATDPAGHATWVRVFKR